MNLTSIILIFGVPFLIPLVQAVGLRVFTFNPKSRQKMTICYSLSTCVLVWVALCVLEPTWYRHFSSLIMVLSCTLALSHVYFHIFNMSETARRIKILTQVKTGQVIQVHDGKNIEPQEGQSSEEYSATGIIHTRVDRLLDWGSIYEKDNKVFVKKSVLSVVAVLMKKHQRWLNF